MKFYLLPTLLSFTLLVSPHLCAKKSAGPSAKRQCSEPANWKISDWNSFSLGNSQFDDFSSSLEGSRGKNCKGLLWLNVTADDFNLHHPDTVHLDPYCPDVICRCLNCGSRGMENQAFSGYVDSETGICHTPWDTDVQVKKYQILTNPCGMKLEWVKAGKNTKLGAVPACSVVGGFEATAYQYVMSGQPPYGDHGSLSYVGRAKGDDGAYYGGKVHAVDQTFYYPYKGNQKSSAEYEVLVLIN